MIKIMTSKKFYEALDNEAKKTARAYTLELGNLYHNLSNLCNELEYLNNVTPTYIYYNVFDNTLSTTKERIGRNPVYKYVGTL